MIAHLAPLALLAATLAAQQPRAPERTFRVAGRVVDARGEPVPNAEVWVAPETDPLTVLAKGRTDGEGQYFLTTPVVLGLVAHARAAGTTQVRSWLGEDRRFGTIRLFDAVTVRGRVVDRVNDLEGLLS